MKRYLVTAILVILLSCESKKANKETIKKMQDNPLIAVSDLDYGAPDFTKIKNEHFMSAIKHGMALQNAEI